jgi:uncharacterized protein (TIGR02270 family)
MYKDYVSNSAYLWFLRSTALVDINYKISDIAELEERIEANLDGLMTSVSTAWPICESVIESGQSGDIFTASVIAFRSNDMDKIKTVISAGLINDDAFDGVISALGWLSTNIVNSWLIKLLNSKDINHKYLAIAAYSIRRIDPGELLTKLFQREDCLKHIKLYARALRLIGELKRQDLKSVLNVAMNSENEELAFWANWSAILLGNKSAAHNLKPYLIKEGVYQNNALQIVFRVLPGDLARSWISEMVKNETDIKIIIKSVATLGDPHAINWLINIMKQSEYSQVAADAFCQITGIDLEEHNLFIEQTSDENINTENLPKLDINKISEIWQQFGNKLKAGHRYILGNKISAELLKNTIRHRPQQLRHCAALELALIVPDQILINICQRVNGAE